MAVIISWNKLVFFPLGKWLCAQWPLYGIATWQFTGCKVTVSGNPLLELTYKKKNVTEVSKLV